VQALVRALNNAGCKWPLGAVASIALERFKPWTSAISSAEGNQL
jgi:hypothetical protein